VDKAVGDFEERFRRSATARLSHAIRARLENLIAGDNTKQGTDGGAMVPEPRSP
jgi:hypothetical protein